jgi:chromosome segregation ATPase
MEGPRDPVTGRLKKPRPPPSEKQLESLKKAQERKAVLVAERKRLMEEAKAAGAKLGVNKHTFGLMQKEMEERKSEIEKLKAELNEERKNKPDGSGQRSKKAKVESSSSESESDYSSDEESFAPSAPMVYFY